MPTDLIALAELAASLGLTLADLLALGWEWVCTFVGSTTPVGVP